MPNRILRDSALGSKKLAAISAEAERLYWRLIMVADDFGRFDADPPVVLSKCFPRHRDYNVKQVIRWFREIVGVGLVTPYTVNGDEIGEIVKWAKYQRVRNARSRFPGPSEHSSTQLSGGREGNTGLSSERQCAYCGLSEVELSQATQREHFVPVARGGSDDSENLILACGHCNHAKGSRVFETVDECRDWLYLYFSKSMNPSHLTIRSLGFATIRRDSPRLAAKFGPDVDVVEDVDVDVKDHCALEDGARASAEAFEQFWNSYPKDRRRGKFEARKAWAELRPSPKRVADMMASLESWKQSADWTKDGGKFIPWPQKFLRKHRWEETPEPEKDGLFSEAERRFMQWKPSGGPKPA